MSQTLMNNILISISIILIGILINKVVYFTVMDYPSPVLVSGFYQLPKMNRSNFFILLNIGTIFIIEKTFLFQSFP